MIICGDKVYRNLEEQVGKNQADIADLISINGNLGIKVVGEITSLSELPAEDGEVFAALEYGDTYALNTSEEADVYHFFVKTRPNETKDYAHWFELNVQGIQGPRGPVGPAGERGLRGVGVKTGTSDNPATVSGEPLETGDTMLVAANGNLYYYTEDPSVPSGYSLEYKGNIRGPQGIQGVAGERGERGERGIQGVKGDKGDVGGFINIRGKVATIDDLPSPSTLGDLSAAYLVGNDDDGYHLYIQIGTSSATAVWDDQGILNVATYVTVNGQFVNIWSADTKVDVVDNENIELYGHAGHTQTVFTASNAADANTIPMRTNGGQIKVADPVLDVDAVNKHTLEGALENLPIANANTIGGIKVGNGDRGISVNSESGIAGIVKATTTDINNRNNNYNPIVPSNLDVAIKASLTDYKGEVWTSAQKAAARDLIGAGTGGGGGGGIPQYVKEYDSSATRWFKNYQTDLAKKLIAYIDYAEAYDTDVITIYLGKDYDDPIEVLSFELENTESYQRLQVKIEIDVTSGAGFLTAEFGKGSATYGFEPSKRYISPLQISSGYDYIEIDAPYNGTNSTMKVLVAK